MADLLFDVEDGIATITLNRPDALNAFSLDMITRWIRALEEVRDRVDIRVLVLTGTGKAFCSGGDIKAMRNGEGLVGRTCGEEVDLVSTPLAIKNSLWKYIQRIPLLLEEIDKPVLAAINGAAIGAGLDMALMCDIRFCADTARVGARYIKAGIVPGDGAAYYLPRIIGADRALHLLWTGEVLTADAAQQMGLVTRVVPQETLMEDVYAYARQLASGPQEAARMIKRLVQQGPDMSLRTYFDLVSSFMALAMNHPDYPEAVAALVERRPPQFT